MCPLLLWGGVLLLGYKFSIKYIIKQFFPITFENNWFVGCYIIIYFIHPFLNKVIRNVSKKELLMLNCFNIGLYGVIQLFVGYQRYFYNNLIGFMCLYFLVGFTKLYGNEFVCNRKLNFNILIICIALWIGGLLVLDVVGLHVEILSNKMLYWLNFMNPVLTAIGLSMFNLFWTKKEFYSKWINELSKCSLLIYLISENPTIKEYLKQSYFKTVYINYSYDYILLWSILLAVILFLISFLLALFYKKISKYIYIIPDRISSKVERVFNCFSSTI